MDHSILNGIHNRSLVQRSYSLQEQSLFAADEQMCDDDVFLIGKNGIE